MLSLEKELITIKTMYNCDQHQQNVAAPQQHHRCDGGVGSSGVCLIINHN